MESELEQKALGGDKKALDQLVKLRVEQAEKRAENAEKRAEQAEERAAKLAASRMQILGLWKSDRERYQTDMNKLFEELKTVYASQHEVVSELQHLRSDIIVNAFRRRNSFSMSCSTFKRRVHGPQAQGLGKRS